MQQYLFMPLLTRTLTSRQSDSVGKFLLKMHGEGCNAAAIAAFRYNYSKLVSGESLMLPEIDIWPVDSLPVLEEVRGAHAAV